MKLIVIELMIYGYTQKFAKKKTFSFTLFGMYNVSSKNYEYTFNLISGTAKWKMNVFDRGDAMGK